MNSPWLAADELERSAREQTGLEDFGDPHYRSGLDVLVRSLNVDGPLHDAGKAAMRGLLELRLSARLRLQDHIKQRPSLASWEADQGAVFVVGTLRSGTTFLYNLLALDPQARSPQLWETMDPIPPASLCRPDEVQARISSMDKMLETYNTNLPQLTRIHHFHSAVQVEECSGLLEPAFRSPSIAYFLWGGPTYYRWLASQPSAAIETAFRDYKAMVAALMEGHEGRFWLSKCPLYAPCVAEMAAVFPNAKFIHTHREPRERIPSACSLLSNFQAVYATPRPADVARQVLFYNEQALSGIERARRGPSGKNTVDVAYEELLASPLETVRGVYDSFGLEFTQAHRNSIADWAGNRNPYDPGRVGKGLAESDLATLPP